jgi:hypothetical protein
MILESLNVIDERRVRSETYSQSSTCICRNVLQDCNTGTWDTLSSQTFPK